MTNSRMHAISVRTPVSSTMTERAVGGWHSAGNCPRLHSIRITLNVIGLVPFDSFSRVPDRFAGQVSLEDANALAGLVALAHQARDLPLEVRQEFAVAHVSGRSRRRAP